MFVRKATEKDAKVIAKLKEETFKHINSIDHSKEQVKALIQANTEEKVKEKIRERDYYCAVEGEEILGTIEIVENRIIGLCVKHTKTRKGVGKTLVIFAEKEIKSNGSTGIILLSTPTAHKFYRACGYKNVEEKNIEIQKTQFTVLEMEKKIQC